MTAGEAAALRTRRVREVVEEIGVRLDPSRRSPRSPTSRRRLHAPPLLDLVLRRGPACRRRAGLRARRGRRSPGSRRRRRSSGWRRARSRCGSRRPARSSGCSRPAPGPPRTSLSGPVGPDASRRGSRRTRDEVRFAFGAAGGLPGPAGARRRCVGRREVVLVDPGDPSEEAIRLIDETVERRGGTIRAVVLTAPDPDHAAGAEVARDPHEVPVLVAPGAGRRLPYASSSSARAIRCRPTFRSVSGSGRPDPAASSSLDPGSAGE